MVCVALASFFWLLNALTKTYTTGIDLPVRYQNLPQDEILLSTLPKKTKVEVESFGFNLLAYRFSYIGDSVFLDVANSKKSRRELNHVYGIPTAPALGALMNELPSEIKLKRMLMDTIYFETQKRGEKFLRVVPQLDLSYDQQHILEDDITVKPERVKVSGAISLLDTVLELRLKPLQLSGLNNDISLEIEFEALEGLTIHADKAIVYIPVDQMTEKEVEIPITVLNLPDSMNIRLFPNKIRAKVQTPVSRYNEFTSNDFSFTVDYNDLLEANGVLYPKEERKPRYCRISAFEPKRVEFVVEK